MNNQTQFGVASKFSALLLAGAAIAALSFATPALAATPVLSSACGTSNPTGSTNWTPTSASSWFTASNWDHGVPTLATPQTNINVSGGTAQINGSAANAGPVLNLCNGTVDVQTGGSLTEGSIAVGASGTLLLSGSTTVTTDPTGAIYLDGGLLRDAFTGTLSSNIVVGDSATKSGTISVAAGKTLTYTGALSFGVNSANLVFGSSTDTGTFVYAPTVPVIASPFAPAIDSIEIAGGTLQAGDNSLGNLLTPLGISTKVDSGATLDFNGHFAEVNNLTGAGHVISTTALTIDSGQFSGIISGTGQLVKDTLCDVVPPPSTTCTNSLLILSGANTYSGGTLISDGTLQIGSGGASGSIVGNITDNDTLAFDRSDVFLFNGVISGSGILQQIGTGNTVLNGTNTYSGNTTVSAGTLTVDGSIDNSSVTVSSGGTLSGIGSVKSATVASGGTIAPGGVGSNIGTLTIDNTLTLQTGGDYLVAVTAIASSKLDVLGAATIGGTLSVTANSHPDATKTYTVLTSTGLLTGTFTLAPGAAGAYMPHLTYDAHDVFLKFTLINFSALLPTAATTNQKAAFAAIDHAIAQGDTLPAAFSSLAGLSQTAAADAATQLSGELGSDLPRLTASEVNPFLTVLMNEPGNLDTGLGMRHARNGRLWGSFFGGGGNTTGDDTIGSHSLSDHVFGFAAGLDLPITPSFITGAALAFSQTNFTLADELGTAHDTAIQLGLYATKRFGRSFYASIAGAYALQSATTSRTLVEGTTSFELSGKVSPKTAAGRFETGYRLGGRLGLTPYVAVQYDRFNAPAYTETGDAAAAPLGLSYAAQTTPTTSFEAGAGIDYSAISSRNASLHLYARAAYQHSNVSDATAVVAFNGLKDSTSALNAPFTVQGTAAGANAALLAFGAEMRGKNGLSLGVKANGALSQGAKDYFATGNIGYSW